MSEKVVLLLNNKMETLGVSDLCANVGWQIEGVSLVRDIKNKCDHSALPNHSIALLCVGPSDVAFLRDYAEKYNVDAVKTMVLFRGDVDHTEIEPVAEHFNGIVSSSSDNDDITAAMRLVAQGFQVTSHTAKFEPAQMRASIDQSSLFEYLSAREVEICQEVTRGLSNKEIALRLQISANTVNAHLASIRHKLDLRNRTEIAVWLRDHVEIS